MVKKLAVLLLTLVMIISAVSAVYFTASAALTSNNQSKQLMVSGNQIVYVDEPTKTVRLTGVNVPGGEWTGTPSVERIDRSITWAIDNWNANFIRLPVSINGWYGNYSYVYDGGNGFRNYIDTCINIASERGVYVILDLHQYTSFNKTEYLDFWKDAAVRYKNNPTVLFGILNEPHSISWDVWRNGNGSDITGHQQVVEMIRDLGAKNIIVAGGLDWAYDLTGISTGGYALVDQGSNNDKSKSGYGIMYDSHVYPWKGHTANWDSKVGAARKLYPVVIGECGWDIGTINEIAGKDPQPGDKLYHDMWCPELLAWMDDDTTYGAMAHYTAYCMHPSSAPQLISSTDADGNAWKDANYSYTPNEYWGAYLVPHLQASVNTRYGTTSGIQVSSMSVVNTKTTYNVGDSFDRSQGYLDITCTDGTKTTVNLSDSDVLISGFDSATATESQTITVTYGGVNATYTVAIKDANSATLSSISVSNVTTSYAVGDTFIKPTVTAKYSDGSTKTVSDAAFSGYNMQTHGEQTVTVSYGGKSVTYKITITAPEKVVESITVINPKTAYTWGDTFEEPIVKASYTNKYYPDETVTGVTFNNYSMTEVRTHTVRAIYGGKTTTFTITVSAPVKEIASITVNDPKTDYVVDDMFITPSVTVNYTSAYYPSISAVPTCTGYNMAKTGTQTVTATYSGKTTTYQITVREEGTTAVTLSSIAVSDAKTAYNVGDAFVAPTVTAFYSDGSTKVVTADFSGYDMAKAGTQTVTVTYEGKTTTYQITVTAVTNASDFVFEVGNVTTEKGATTVSVPLNITKFFANETIGGFSINVKYDTSKFTYTGMTFGDMIPNKSDMDYAESTPGTIFIGFSTADQPITSAGIAANSLFATITFEVKDAAAGTTNELTIEAASKMTNNDLVTLVSKSNLKNCLVAGSITVPANEVTPPVVTLTSISVSGQKTSYTTGDAFVKPTVTAIYSDGSTKTVTDAVFTGYNMSTAGTYTVTVTYEGKTTTYQITVQAPVATLASIVVSNAKVDYNVGDSFVKPTVTAIYSDGSTKTVTDAVFTGYNMSTEGTYTVTVSYSGKTTTYKITVTAPVVVPPVEDTEFIFEVGNVTAEKGATTVSVPLNITKFFANETIGGFSVNLKYDTTKLAYTGMTFGDMIPNKSDMDYAESTPGTIFIGFSTADQPITSAGIAADNLFATVTFTVKEAGTSDISISAASKMTNNDLVTLVSKSNLKDCLVGGSITVPENEITPPVVTLTSISVSGQKTSYTTGDAFVKPTVTAFYSDGSTKTVTDAVFTGYNMSTEGTQTVTVSYSGKTTTYKITVTAPVVVPPVVDTDFVFKVADVEADKGTTVEVPLTIEKFFANETIGGFSVNLKYDTTKLTYKSMTFGDMIPNKSDMDYAESTPGTIFVGFSTADQPITSAGIAANKLFATVTFEVKEAGTSKIGISAASKMTNNDLVTLVSKSNLKDCLQSGSVTVEGKKLPGYHATVTEKHHQGFGHGNNKFHYIKHFVLTEGNGNFIIRIGDYELVWSVERQCYVGASAPDDYILDDNAFNNITITEGTPKTIKKYCDVTGDDRINGSDIAAMRRFMELGIDLDEAYAGDANIDGYINATDFSIMRNHIELDIPIFE